MKPLRERLLDGPLLADGAMGTQLIASGLEPGTSGDGWNLSHPDRVLAVQRRYVEAGSDCLLTNTFGGSRLMLARHGLAGDAVALNRAAVALARAAFGDTGGYVIGDIGPFGGLLEPYGDTPVAEAEDAIREQVQALVGAGVDAIIVETQTSLEELAIGLRAAVDAGAPCVIGSMAFDVTHDGRSLRTMMGVNPERAAAFMRDCGAHVVGLNCGAGMDVAHARDGVRLFRQVTNLPLMAQPNAGRPRLDGVVTVYDETPAAMAEGIAVLLDEGAAIVGGCCGTTPDHIRAFRRVIDARRA